MILGRRQTDPNTSTGEGDNLNFIPKLSNLYYDLRAKTRGDSSERVALTRSSRGLERGGQPRYCVTWYGPEVVSSQGLRVHSTEASQTRSLVSPRLSPTFVRFIRLRYGSSKRKRNLS